MIWVVLVAVLTGSGGVVGGEVTTLSSTTTLTTGLSSVSASQVTPTIEIKSHQRVRKKPSAAYTGRTLDANNKMTAKQTTATFLASGVTLSLSLSRLRMSYLSNYRA
ncbi:hypothetical protein COU14_01755 [Candidatus Kaiserbacteria bacterium CG10_big_fil_rev_8_21_14_0_10_44_10]|uniref:Uncharacterized protein n=1 Tax=Candidatus Kaiserbacteria bacterium CG10_big_fil_rev_8_21_14_0_10_44_10 TaxID=1974606 RepID=A0A2H0UJR7_9BACT|nr:MAG: hypothetical protein COU14_01755 [Candidatus Kaiserbacteria bacterium CG10_big_fil_rev_8_21_14_0_10_44_10]